MVKLVDNEYSGEGDDDGTQRDDLHSHLDFLHPVHHCGAPQLGFIFEQVGRLGLHLVEGELINGVGKMLDGFGIPSSRTE